MSDVEAAASALVENLQRQDLNPIEEAQGYVRLIEEFGLTHEALGSAVGKSRAHIGSVLRLLRLPSSVQAEVRSGRLSFGHARAILTHHSPESVLPQVIDQGLSVRDTEALIAHLDRPLAVTRRNAMSFDNEDMIRRITLRIGMPIAIAMQTKKSGHLTIRFSSLEQLDEIARALEGRMWDADITAQNSST